MTLLQLALTFTTDAPSSVHAAFAQASPSCLFSFPEKPGSTTPTPTPTPTSGAVVGCEDGSLFLFHNTTLSSSPAKGVSSSHDPSGPRSPSSSSSPHRRTKRSSRSLSPASSLKSPSPFSPFAVTTKASVVSSVSAERVEAPRNYVDFEDEPEKLREMMKNKGGVKERKKVVDAFVLPGDANKVRMPLGKDTCEEMDDEESGDGLKKSDARARSSVSSLSSLSTSTAPSTPSRLVIAPLAPPLAPATLVRLTDPSEFCPWSLTSHTVPLQQPTGAVTSLQSVPGHPLVVALFRSGYVVFLTTFLLFFVRVYLFCECKRFFFSF